MNTAYLGVDVSKGYADFVLLGNDLCFLAEPVQFDDTLNGYESCQMWLNKCIQNYDLNQIRAAVESTGGLENNWMASFKTMLTGFDLKMIRLNPAGVKFASRASLSTVTTDGQSARNIAEYLQRYTQDTDFEAFDNPYAPYKKVITQLKHFTKISTAAKNVFRQLIYEVFPEIQAICPKTLPNWLFKLLKKHPTPARIARAKPTSLTKITGISLQKAETLIFAAKNTAGSARSSSDEMIVLSQIRQIQYQQREIEALKSYLEDTVKGPEVNLLKTITGVGVYSAAVMMIHIGDVRRFTRPQKLASFFGLTPIIRQSGDKKGLSCMSKQGASFVRAILFMCAKSAIIHDPHLRSIYDKQRAMGKNYNQAVGVIMHKLLRIMWGILTTGTPYNSAVDQKNQHNMSSPKNQSELEWNNKRREQSFDELAPVSNQARKQRKEHLLSQAIIVGQVRDLESAPLESKT